MESPIQSDTQSQTLVLIIVIELARPRVCYACKKKYSKVHFFYDQMCPFCASLNYRKRLQSSDLTGRIALVTGARVKIGYQCALKLLRYGAFVIVTTRFPNDAAMRYSKEEDFQQWKDHLHIYGIDFRDIGNVDCFAEYIRKQYKSLDILINNAAQTIRRPPSFYFHLIPTELKCIEELPDYVNVQPMLHNHNKSWKALTQSTSVVQQLVHMKDKMLEDSKSKTLSKLSSISPSAVLPVVPFTPEDAVHDASLFPLNKYDVDNQQVDLRPNNTWSSSIDSVSTVELTEVHAVNAIAPFVLNSKLKSLMTLSQFPDRCIFQSNYKVTLLDIINVSSMEGKFYQPHKSERHPHTNMAKASLNMMTRTIAEAYAHDGIYVNSVDTGWITDEHPLEKMMTQQFEPPLDEIDAMARILDPIFRGMNSNEYDFGLFLKDYQNSCW